MCTVAVLGRVLRPLLAGRGCYWGRCAFCNIAFGERYAPRAVHRVLDDAEQLLRQRAAEKMMHAIDRVAYRHGGEGIAVIAVADREETLPAGLATAMPVLIDQGTDDEFLAEQLFPQDLQAAYAKQGAEITLRMQDGYDHSYFFVSTFMADHVAFHAEALYAG